MCPVALCTSIKKAEAAACGWVLMEEAVRPASPPCPSTVSGVGVPCQAAAQTLEIFHHNVVLPLCYL